MSNCPLCNNEILDYKLICLQCCEELGLNKIEPISEEKRKKMFEDAEKRCKEILNEK